MTKPTSKVKYQLPGDFKPKGFAMEIPNKPVAPKESTVTTDTNKKNNEKK